MFFFSLYWRISWNISGEYFRPKRALIKDSWRIVRNDKSNDDWLDLQSEQFCKSRPVSFPGRRPLHPSHCEGNTFFGLLVKLLMFVLLLLFFVFLGISLSQKLLFLFIVFIQFLCYCFCCCWFLFSSFIITFFSAGCAALQHRFWILHAAGDREINQHQCYHKEYIWGAPPSLPRKR